MRFPCMVKMMSTSVSQNTASHVCCTCCTAVSSGIGRLLAYKFSLVESQSSPPPEMLAGGFFIFISFSHARHGIYAEHNTGTHSRIFGAEPFERSFAFLRAQEPRPFECIFIFVRAQEPRPSSDT